MHTVTLRDIMIFTICTLTLTSEEIVRPGEGPKGLHLQIDIATTAVVNYIIWFLHSFTTYY